MSQDPNYGYGYTPEPPPGVPPGYPLPGAPDLTVVRQRVQVPAIFLIVVGVINLLIGLAQAALTAREVGRPAQEIWEERRELMEDRLGLKGAMSGYTPDQLKTQDVITNSIVSGLEILAALLTLLGGTRMYALRSYGLSVTGAIAASIPILSCLACCGLGEIAGVWALIVLMNAEVRSAFR